MYLEFWIIQKGREGGHVMHQILSYGRKEGELEEM